MIMNKRNEIKLTYVAFSFFFFFYFLFLNYFTKLTCDIFIKLPKNKNKEGEFYACKR